MNNIVKHPALPAYNVKNCTAGRAFIDFIGNIVIQPAPHAYNVKMSIAGGAFMKGSNLFKHKQIEERAVEIAEYIVDKNATVRQTAKQFGISKSTVHKDITERLLTIHPALAERTRQVLDLNKSERHIRGGMATREKYLHNKGHE